MSFSKFSPGLDFLYFLSWQCCMKDSSHKWSPYERVFVLGLSHRWCPSKCQHSLPDTPWFLVITKCPQLLDIFTAMDSLSIFVLPCYIFSWPSLWKTFNTNLCKHGPGKSGHKAEEGDINLILDFLSFLFILYSYPILLLLLFYSSLFLETVLNVGY